MGQQTGLVTNGRDAADRIRQEGWDYDIRSRDAARQAASMADTSDRLQPLIVPTGHGPDQLLRILETLARVELTDGLTLAQLITRNDQPHAAGRHGGGHPALGQRGSGHRAGEPQTPRLGGHGGAERLRGIRLRPGSGPLLAQGIETRQLKDEAQLVSLCRAFVLR